MPEIHRDFFISFNSADTAHAEAIDAALREAGFTTFFHPRDVRPGDNIPAWMEGALLNSTQTLALFSPDYVKDTAAYSFAERYATWWRDARGEARRLIPVVLSDVDFKMYPLLGMHARIDVRQKNPQQSAMEVVRRLKSHDETKLRDAAQPESHLPKVFHVLYRPNPNFSGRFEDLDALQKSLREGNAAITAVAGMGGVGKTTIAAEYCHRFGSRYGGVWWIRAEQESVMLGDLVALGERLGLEQSGHITRDAEQCVEHLTTQPEPWLLVYDNAPDANAIGKYIPAGSTRSIITSRRNDFDQIGKVVSLDEWTNEITADYLLSRTGRVDVGGASRLAKSLGGLPLAAEQSAVFLRMRQGISFDDYAADLSRLIKLPKPAGATGEYSDTVYAAFVKSLNEVGKLSHGETAIDILRLCAFLSPDGVDLERLLANSDGSILPEAFATAMADKFARADALAALSSFSLIRFEKARAGGALIVHRLLSEVCRDLMTADQTNLWCGVAAQLVDASFPWDAAVNPSRWPDCARLLPHVVPLASFAYGANEDGKALCRLLSKAGQYLNARGEHEAALDFTKRSVELSRDVFRDEPLIIFKILNNLSVRYLQLARLDDAEKILREALSFHEDFLKGDNEGLGAALSNLAEIYASRGDYPDAEQLYLRSAETLKESHGETSAEYGTVLSNLGSLYSRWSKLPGEEARQELEHQYKTKELVICLAARGPRHPETAISYNNLAIMHSVRGNWSTAAELMAKAVAIMLSLDLQNHPSTQRRAQDLFRCLIESGQSAVAEQLRKGDAAFLRLAIEAIEREQTAWVAQDPEKRRFGPPSPVTGAIE